MLGYAAGAAGRAAVSQGERVSYRDGDAGRAGEGEQVREEGGVQRSDVLPVLTRKQSSAFPPNFVQAKNWREG